MVWAMSSGCPPNKIVHLSSICHVPDTVCVISANAHNNPGEDPSLPPFIGEPAKHRGEGTGPKSHSWQVAEPGHCLTQSQCLFTTPTTSLLLPPNRAPDVGGILVGFWAASLAPLAGGTAITCPRGDIFLTLLCSRASLVGWVRLIGDVSAFPGALSFLYNKSWVFFLFLACKIFHHLLCLGRMFAENISSSLIPIISGGFGSLQAEQQQLTRASQAHRLLVVLVPGRRMSCSPEITSPLSLSQRGALGSLH